MVQSFETRQLCLAVGELAHVLLLERVLDELAQQFLLLELASVRRSCQIGGQEGAGRNRADEQQGRHPARLPAEQSLSP